MTKLRRVTLIAFASLLLAASSNALAINQKNYFSRVLGFYLGEQILIDGADEVDINGYSQGLKHGFQGKEPDLEQASATDYEKVLLKTKQLTQRYFFYCSAKSYQKSYLLGYKHGTLLKVPTLQPVIAPNFNHEKIAAGVKASLLLNTAFGPYTDSAHTMVYIIKSSPQFQLIKKLMMPFILQARAELIAERDAKNQSCRNLSKFKDI